MTYSAEVLADTPVFFYRMGDSSGATMTDSSGNALHGTYQSTINQTYGVTGLLTGDADTCITFGSAGWATSPVSTLLNSTQVTVEFWIKGSNFSSFQTPIGWGSAWLVNIIGTSASGWVPAYPGFSVYDVSGTIPQARSSVAINDGVAHHVVGVYDGSIAYIYVDGRLVGSSVYNVSMPNPAGQKVGINGDPPGQGITYGQYLTTIDEVAVYATALSPTRVKAHYYTGKGLIPIFGTDAAVLPAESGAVSIGKASSDAGVLGNTVSISATVTASEARVSTSTNVVVVTKADTDARTGADTANTPGPITADTATIAEGQSIVNLVAIQPLSFTQLADFPDGPLGTKVCMAYDGDNLIYVLGPTTKILWAYDLTTLHWTSVNTAAPHGHATGAMAYVDGVLYAFCEDDFFTTGVAFALNIYDIATDTWSVGANVPVPHSGGGGTSVVTVGQDIYIACHWTDPIDFVRYTPSTDSYATLASGSSAGIEGFGAGLAYDGDGSTLWWVNGWFTSSSPPGTVIKYSIASDVWTATTGVDPHAAEDQTCGFVDGKLVVIGGDDASSQLNAVRYYDPTTNSWTTLPVTLPIAVQNASSVVVGKKIYVLGGGDSSFNYPTLQVIDLAAIDDTDPRRDSFTFTETESVVPSIFLGGGPHTSWSFIDPQGVLADYFFEINPNKMSDPLLKKSTTSLGKSPSGVQRAWRNNNKAPREWTFSGVTRTKQQEDNFKTWYDLRQKIWLRDHLGRVWEIRLTKFAPEPRRPSATNQYRYTYTFTASVYRKVAG